MTVSVIIPCYNAERFVGQAIRSVLDQTRRPDEIIVVDDGSTDRTAAIVRSFGAELRFLQIRHTGLPARVRNVGVEASKSELIAFLDADDVWDSRKLERQEEIFHRRADATLVCTDICLVDEEGKHLQDSEYVRWARSQFRDLMKEPLSTLLQGNVVSTSSVMLWRESLVEVGLLPVSYELDQAEDYATWVKLALRGGFYVIEEPLVFYRIGSANISFRKVPEEVHRRRMVSLAELWCSYYCSRTQQLADRSYVMLIKRGAYAAKQRFLRFQLLGVIKMVALLVGMCVNRLLGEGKSRLRRVSVGHASKKER